MTRQEAINKWIIPTIKNTWNENKCKEILEALEQEPCEDCISREGVISQIEYVLSHSDSELRKGLEDTLRKAKTCISIQPNTDVLDKIRAEIEQEQDDFMDDKDYDEGVRFGLMSAYQIIDRYRGEDFNE